MNYFSKLNNNNELWVTSLSEDSGIMILTGDYIELWELIQSSSEKIDIQSEKLASSFEDLSGSNNKEFKSFLIFLKFNKFNYEIKPKTTDKIKSIISKGLIGEYKLFEVEDGNNSIPVFGSPAGEDPYNPYGVEWFENHDWQSK